MLGYALSQLGSPSTSNARSEVPNSPLDSDIKRVLYNIGTYGQLIEKTDAGFNLFEQLDGLLSLSAVLRVNLINTILVSCHEEKLFLGFLFLQTAAFITLWTVMRALPPRASARHILRRRSVHFLTYVEKAITSLDTNLQTTSFENTMVNLNDEKGLQY